MKFENTRVMNFEGAFHGARNPMNSWNKSDSFFGIAQPEYDAYDYDIADLWMKKNHSDIYIGSNEYDEKLTKYSDWLISNGILYGNNNDGCLEVAFLGPNDLDLAQRLIKAGPEHRKFLRQIFVSVDITGPLYWWKEFDTYKVGTVANSCSTMHKIHEKRFEREDFSIEHLENCDEQHWMVCMDNIINNCSFIYDYQILSKK